MEKLIKHVRKILKPYYKALSHKQHIDFVIATLTVPILILSLIVNVNNLKPKSVTVTPTPTIIPEKVVYITQPEIIPSHPVVISSAPTGPCTKTLGPISIVSPDEGDVVTTNPVTIDVEYDQGNYCGAVWSYRINGGTWSDYDDQSISLFNPPEGNIKLELRVKSVVSNDQKVLTRNFVYHNPNATLMPTISNTNNQSSASAH